MNNSSRKAISVLRRGGPAQLIKEGTEKIRRKITAHRIRLNSINDCESLPKYMEISPQIIKWKSSFSSREFPTKDSVTECSDTLHNYPIVGIVGGRWDEYKYSWNSSTHHKSLVNRFEHGVEWEQTKLYQRKTSELSSSEDINKNSKILIYYTDL